MPFWDERVAAIAREFPDVRTDQYHIDILTAQFVQHPDWFDVVVGSNLFGDILSDLGPAVAGGIGIAPSANLNPERAYPSMFEPVHGSAPDIEGKGIANPVATLWSVVMMLEFLGEEEAAKALMVAIEGMTAEARALTPDLGAGRAPENAPMPFWRSFKREYQAISHSPQSQKEKGLGEKLLAKSRPQQERRA